MNQQQNMIGELGASQINEFYHLCLYNILNLGDMHPQHPKKHELQ